MSGCASDGIPKWIAAFARQMRSGISLKKVFERRNFALGIYIGRLILDNTRRFCRSYAWINASKHVKPKQGIIQSSYNVITLGA